MCVYFASVDQQVGILIRSQSVITKTRYSAYERRRRRAFVNGVHITHASVYRAQFGHTQSSRKVHKYLLFFVLHRVYLYLVIIYCASQIHTHMSEQQVAPATPPSPSENNVVAFNSREQVARVVVATKSSSFASRGSSTASKKKRVSGESSSDTAAFAGLAPATKHARPAEQLPATPVTLGQLSDSSDSNNGNSAKIPFVNTAECTMAHDGQQMVNVILPVNIDILFKTLYTNSKFLEDFHESRKITDAVHTEWTDANTPAGTLRHRSFRCKIPFKKAMGFTMVSEVIVSVHFIYLLNFETSKYHTVNLSY